MEKQELLRNILEATAGGYYQCDINKVLDIYEMLNPGAVVCRVCSQNKIQAYNFLKKYAKEIQDKG